MSHVPSEYLEVGKCIIHLYQHPIDIDGHKDADEVAAHSPQAPNYNTDPSSGNSCTQISRKSEGRMKQII